MADSRKPFRILFVCMGNICRSPAAEIVFRKLVADAGLEDAFEIDSAGTIGYHAGRPPDPRMARTLGGRGYSVTGCARQIRAADLADFDLILTMDDENLENVRALDPAGRFHEKIRPITSFCTRSKDRHVPDPYYGGQSGFDHVIDLLEDACAGVVEWRVKSEE